MPKSRARRGARKYRGKQYAPIDVYSLAPDETLRRIAVGALNRREERAACDLLLATYPSTIPQLTKDLFHRGGYDTWPPRTHDDIRSIARLAFPQESNEQRREEAGSATTDAGDQ